MSISRGLDSVVTPDPLTHFNDVFPQNPLNFQDSQGMLMNFLVGCGNNNFRFCLFELGTGDRHDPISFTDDSHAEPCIKGVGLDDPENIVMLDPWGRFRGDHFLKERGFRRQTVDTRIDGEQFGVIEVVRVLFDDFLLLTDKHVGEHEELTAEPLRRTIRELTASVRRANGDHSFDAGVWRKEHDLL